MNSLIMENGKRSIGVKRVFDDIDVGSITIGIYCRVSTDKQEKEGNSLEFQKNIGVSYIESIGFKVDVYEEVVSGTKKGVDRKVFSVVESKLRSGELGGIWIYDIDRMVREMGVGYDFREMIKEVGCLLFVGYELLDLGTYVGKMRFSMGSMLGEMFRDKLVEVFKEGKYNKWNKGKGFQGQVGFGYKRIRINGESEIVGKEIEKNIVKDIYKIFLMKNVNKFDSVWDRIYKKYDKYKNDDGKIYGIGDSGRIRDILIDEKYKGKYIITDKYGDDYEFVRERLVDDEMWDKVQIKVNKIKKGRIGSGKKDYLLKGKLYCGWCNESMWKRESGNVNGRGKGKYGYYMCSTNNKKKYSRRYESKFNEDLKDCVSKDYGNNNIGLEVIEKIVWDYMFIVLKNSEIVKESYRKTYSSSVGERKDLDGKLGYYERELSNLDDKRIKFMNMYVDGDFSKEDYDLYIKKEIEEKKKVLNNKIVGIKDELGKVEVVDNIDGIVDYMKEELKKDWKKERFEDKKRVIDKWISRVFVKRFEDKSIEVYLNFNINVDDLFYGDDRLVVLGDDNKNKIMLLKERNTYIKDLINSFDLVVVLLCELGIGNVCVKHIKIDV